MLALAMAVFAFVKLLSPMLFSDSASQSAPGYYYASLTIISLALALAFWFRSVVSRQRLIWILSNTTPQPATARLSFKNTQNSESRITISAILSFKSAQDEEQQKWMMIFDRGGFWLSQRVEHEIPARVYCDPETHLPVALETAMGVFWKASGKEAVRKL